MIRKILHFTKYSKNEEKMKKDDIKNRSIITKILHFAENEIAVILVYSRINLINLV